jgi:protocatechuate 3,4-dioxygenase beta subunit
MKRKILTLTIVGLLTATISPATFAAAKSCKSTQAIEEGPYYLASTPTRSDVTDGQAGKSITIHIHEKKWVNNKQVLTTQTYFTDAQNSAVMATAPYSARGAQRVTNKTDMILNRGRIDLNAALMKVVGSEASAVITVKNL